ncbi:hypothetical protein P3X46_025559 [Hevea brasiliensis]|uniref:BED-type domain-containing protein n=1 Tax=Hevea brasiliensis TaxID=3981 RepID=A0ABQ9L8N8_HEVBR|nr:probable disease resistance protein At4g27220 [Hevea brasiliensis]KAJ9160128.1 hypothetical protein P3X46_025559 [Hevea brasiliensis]
MGRPKDQKFSEYAERIGSDLKCKFCGNVFKGSPSISRFKYHLAGIPGQGIQICDRVHDDVKEAALEAIQRANKRRKTMRSSNINEVYNPISRPQNHEVEDEERMQMEVQDLEQQVGKAGTSFLLEMEDNVENHVGQSLQFVETKGEKLLTTKLKGEEFETHIKEICSCLRDDDNVSKVGIYGMAGVGKTELAKHVNNELLRTPSPFHYVYWVTVSPDFSIHKLQDTIARMVNLDLSSVDDKHIRAARLFEVLKDKNFVLILDDMWNYVPLEMVGIPDNMKRCKLVLTTRSLKVCRKMDCQKNIKVKPLLVDASWELFLQELGHQITPSLEKIAKSIVLECDGLPLGIKVMARNMKQVDDIHEWSNALDKLRRSIPEQENLEIFNELKRSYDYLNDPTLQQCFLYCALYQGSCYGWYGIRKGMIELLIDVGVIEGESRREEFNEGRTILNKLLNLCLLEEEYAYEVKMHNLLKNMAIQIMNADARVIVRNDEKLSEMPEWGNWSEDLVRISLSCNDIREIPSVYSPSCPNLSTVLLGNNRNLSLIGYSFFEQLHGLKMLDLSWTAIENLPTSISDLVNLRALLLRMCKALRHVPSLAALRALKKLDLYDSGVGKVPEGIELLSNLRYLDLCGTNIAELEPGILPKLSQLRVLRLGFSFTVEGKEVASLRKLEELECRFHGVGELNTFMTCKPSTSQIRCSLCVGRESEDMYGDYFDGSEVYFDDCIISEGGNALSLPRDVKSLTFYYCSIESGGLCFRDAIEPKNFDIKLCEGLEHLFSLSSPDSVFKTLEIIKIHNLKDLYFLFGEGGRNFNGDIPLTVPLSLPHDTFSLLEKFEICNCPSMKKLFPQSLMSNLQNLEVISVENCNNMEELIASEEGQESCNCNNGNSSIFTLPKLKTVELHDLPKLKSICSGEIFCDSLEKIKVRNCPKLKRIAFSLFLRDHSQLSPLPSLRAIIIYPTESWDLIEFDHSDAKNVLLDYGFFPDLY